MTLFCVRHLGNGWTMHSPKSDERTKMQQKQPPARPFASRSVIVAMIFTAAYLAVATPYAIWRGVADLRFWHQI